MKLSRLAFSLPVYGELGRLRTETYQGPAGYVATNYKPVSSSRATHTTRSRPSGGVVNTMDRLNVTRAHVKAPPTYIYVCWLAAFLALVAFVPALASELRVPATVLSVYDGDTLNVEAEIWPGLTWQGSVRVRGVDTPEIRGQCDAEREAAKAARDFVRKAAGKTVTLTDIERGMYAGRVVADVLLQDGRDLLDALIGAGHGRAYDGGRREGWC